MMLVQGEGDPQAELYTEVGPTGHGHKEIILFSRSP